MRWSAKPIAFYFIGVFFSITTCSIRVAFANLVSTPNSSLATGHVYSLALDNHALYLGAENGFFKVSGTQIKRLDTLDSSFGAGVISQMEIGTDGKVWMLRQGDGVYRYDPSTDILLRIDLPTALASQAVQFGVGQSSLVIASADELSWWSFSGSPIQRMTHINGHSLQKISTLTVADSGDIWLADQHNLYHLSGAMETTRTLLTQAFPREVRVTALYSHQGKLYALGWNGLYELNKAGDVAYHFPFNGNEPQPMLRGDIRLDSDGNIWIAANGLYFLDRELGALVSPPIQQPLLKPQYLGRLLAIDTNKDGELVVASTRRGVFSVPTSAKAINYLHHDGRIAQQTIRQAFALNQHTAIVRDGEHSYWLDTSSGQLSELQIDNLNYPKVLIPLPNGRALIVDNCTMLELNGVGLSQIPLPQERCFGLTSIYSQSPNTTLVHQQVEGQQGIVWLDQDAMVQRRETIDVTPVALGSYADEFAIVVANNREILWQTDAGWQSQSLNAMAMNSIQCMTTYKSVLSLCAAGQGEVQLDLNQGTWLAEFKWDHDSMFVRDVYRDADGNRWQITNLGLQVYLEKSSTFHYLNKFDGVFDVDFAPDGIIPLNNSKILLLGAQQQYVIDTRTLLDALTKRHSKPMAVAYSSLSFDVASVFSRSVDTEHHYLGRAGVPRVLVDVPYSATQLEIDFELPLLPGEIGPELEYNMAGIQDYWTPLNRLATSLQFAELPIGQNRLQIRVSGSNRSIEQPISELIINVQPPLWLSAPAYLVYLFVLSSITGYFVVRLKRQLERDKAHLKALVRAKDLALFEGQQNIRHLLERRETLLSALAFELRGPLQNIDEPLGEIDQESESQATRARLEIIQRNTRKMRQLITQLTELERLEASKLLPKQLYDVDATLTDTVNGYLNLNMLPASKINIVGERGLQFACLANSFDKIIYGLLDYVVANVAPNDSINVAVTGDQLYIALAVSVQQRSIAEPLIGDTIARAEADVAEVSLALVSKLVSANHGKLNLQTNGYGIEVSVKFRLPDDLHTIKEPAASVIIAAQNTAPAVTNSESKTAYIASKDCALAAPDFCSVKQRQFFNEFVLLLEQRYKDTGFNRARAAHCLALSERQLNRRLAEFNLGNFSLLLRQFRLHKGRRLIESGHQITRVSFEVGFSDAGYFSQRFKQEYGCSPTEYAKHFEVSD